jgi:glycosyltransferase involved in cell wall biosynthesis
VNIAIYIRTIESAQGTERVTANIARGLADRGHSVDFLVEDGSGWLVEQLESHPNINVINLDGHRGPLLLRRGFQLWILLKNIGGGPRVPPGRNDGLAARLLRIIAHDDPPLLPLYRYITRTRPASVMSFLNPQNLLLLLLEPVLKNRTRLIVNVRNNISTSAKHGESKWMRSVPRIMKRFFPRADLIVAPSQGVVDDAQRITGISPDRFRVIYNPVYRPELTELSMENPDHPWFNGSGVPVVIAAGKLKPQKDFDTLLRAFARVRSQRPVRLVILGDGPGYGALMGLAGTLGVKDDFQLPGRVKNPYAYFRRASVFVLSSAWEGLPNVLIEAMACGCPVVSTDCPSGPQEILDGGRVGRLVPVGDAEAMAEAIIAVLDSPPAPQVMIERAREFSFERAIADYEKITCGS